MNHARTAAAVAGLVVATGLTGSVAVQALDGGDDVPDTFEISPEGDLGSLFAPSDDWTGPAPTFTITPAGDLGALLMPSDPATFDWPE